jgi:hypothetical protein
VDSICDIGVVLDLKLNFTSLIDSLIVNDSRMLCYIRRIGKEFRDPYTMKRCIIRSFGLIWIKQASCGTRTMA